MKKNRLIQDCPKKVSEGMNEKVFCKECKFFDDYFRGLDASCLAEGNKKYGFDWRSRFYTKIRHPKAINRYNDCRWHEPKQCGEKINEKGT